MPDQQILVRCFAPVKKLPPTHPFPMCCVCAALSATWCSASSPSHYSSLSPSPGVVYLGSCLYWRCSYEDLAAEERDLTLEMTAFEERFAAWEREGPLSFPLQPPPPGSPTRARAASPPGVPSPARPVVTPGAAGVCAERVEGSGSGKARNGRRKAGREAC